MIVMAVEMTARVSATDPKGPD